MRKRTRRRPLPEPGLITAREAAGRLGVSDKMLAKLCELGYLRPVFLGGTWRRFRAEDVEEVIRGTALRAEIVIADPRARRPLTGAALVQHQRRLAREAAEAGEAPAP